MQNIFVSHTFFRMIRAIERNPQRIEELNQRADALEEVNKVLKRIGKKVKKYIDENECRSYHGKAFSHLSLSATLTLEELLFMKKKNIHKRYIEPLGLQPGIDVVNKQIDFFQSLESADKRILEKVTLISLVNIQTKFGQEKPTIIDALRKDEDLLNLRLKDLSDYRDLDILALRLNIIEEKNPHLLTKNTLHPCKAPSKDTIGELQAFERRDPTLTDESFSELTLKELRMLEEDEVRKLPQKFIKSWKTLLSKKQVEWADLSLRDVRDLYWSPSHY